MCVVGNHFEEKMDELKNAKYRLIELYELKDAMIDGEIQNENKEWEPFNMSPDLKTIIRSELWQDLTQFADYLKKEFGKR